ncbi:MAG: S-layer homology domain-containing protein [Oscillibacter sp.]|nr:S-layer homology domain-containing protein [Oscillibacter sp.]
MPKKLLIGLIAGIVLALGIAAGVFFFLRRGGSPVFEDVPKDYFYFKEIQWAEKNGIISADSGTLFYPDNACTRGDAMLFLWRACGSPPPPPNFRNPFPDIAPVQDYYDAVLWAAEQRITRGTDEGDFWPGGPVTRGQAIVFLYRAVGSPEVDDEKELNFQDIASSDYYETAVRWAVQEKITNGLADNAFLAHDNCTRAQMVAFLCRCFK